MKLFELKLETRTNKSSQTVKFGSWVIQATDGLY